MTNKEKSDKKIVITFVVLLIISSMAGVMSGVLLGKLEETQNLEDMLGYLENKAAMLFLCAMIVFNVITIGFSLLQIHASKKMITFQDADDEDAYDMYDAIEQKLGFPQLISSVMFILNLFLFIGVFQTTNFDRIKEEPKIQIVFWVSLVVFIIGYSSAFYIQKKVVDFAKQMNPEKRGNIFDFNFRKAWMDSCDEAQQYMAYKAAYKSMSVAQVTCMVLLILMMHAQHIFHAGILPSLVITIIWLVITLTYHVTGAKLERGEE